MTILFGEVYGTCSGTGDRDSAYGSLWANSNQYWRPAMCLGTAKEATLGYTPGCTLFQVNPNWLTECIYTKNQSGHPKGINVAMGDGSVRTIASGISPSTWASLCDPRDGVTPGSDW